jgi:[acyl-carrier-protein] S-malonyltransferase
MSSATPPIQTAIVFPGQGSPILGTGQSLVTAWPDAQDRLEYFSMIADTDITDLLCRGSETNEPAADLADIHLALVSYGMLAFEWLTRVAGYTPHLVAGHSLGEITALACAGVISTEDALILARSRGRLLARACRETNGGMTAFMGKTVTNIRQDIRDWQNNRAQPSAIFEANVNGDRQLVVSGKITDLDRLEPAMARMGIRARRLPVAGPFHSPLMGDAAARFFKITRQLRYSSPDVPILSSVTGQMLTHPGSLPVHLSLQLVNPVEWLMVMKKMTKAGISSLVEVAGKRPVLIPLAVKQENWPVSCTAMEKLIKHPEKGKFNEKQG